MRVIVMAALAALALSTAAPAQVAPASRPAAASESRLILLGTAGGPAANAGRSGPAAALVIDGRVYLFDCAAGSVRQLKRAGFEATDVSQLFLTHLHFDHSGGVAELIGYDWSSGRRRPIQILGPPGVVQLVEGALHYLAIPEALYAAQFPPHEPMAKIALPRDVDVSGRPSLIFEDGRIRVWAVANTHYASPAMRARQPDARSYAYRVDTADRSIVFTGDTGPSPAVEALARNADLLVSEVIDLEAVGDSVKRLFPGRPEAIAPLLGHMAEEHLTPEEVGHLAARAGVKTVVLTHRVPADGPRPGTPGFTERVRRHFGGRVVEADDLDAF